MGINIVLCVRALLSFVYLFMTIGFSIKLICSNGIPMPMKDLEGAKLKGLKNVFEYHEQIDCRWVHFSKDKSTFKLIYQKLRAP
jgi:hypothetical protein